MLKRTVMKSVLGAAVGTGAIALVAFGANTPVALSSYPTSVATSMSTSQSSPTVVLVGSAPQVVVTVSTTNAGSPTGTMAFTITTGTDYETEYAAPAPGAVASSGPNASQASYTFPANAPADQTYKIVSSFTGSNNYSNNSKTSYVTINKYATSTAVTTGASVGYSAASSNNDRRVTVPITVTSTPTSTMSGSVNYSWSVGNGAGQSGSGTATVTNGVASVVFDAPKKSIGTVTITYPASDTYRTSFVTVNISTPS